MMARATRPSRHSSPTASGARPAASTLTLAAGCVNPIRLRGVYQRIAADTGEVLAVFGAPEKGDGILLVSCKDRRASCCPPCSRLYERDAYHLLAAGLRGGKTVPESVATHPAVMLTLTAYSFGAVHGNRDNGQPCKCGRHHDPNDPQLGAAIDPERYRYAEQVIWNHHAPELWKRTAQAIRRSLAQALGIPRSKLADLAHVRFAKVAEFQRRGVVHYHAIIRVDGPAGPETPAPTVCTTKLLEDVVRAGAEAAAITLPETLLAQLETGATRMLRWGAQREVVGLYQHTCTGAAGYIAKYATKATEAATGGRLIKPLRSLEQLNRLPLTDHARSLVRAAWVTGERTGIDAFKRWAHQFGYGGHTLTKSHQYSVTLASLRGARTEWRRAANGEANVIVRAQLAYAGRGYPIKHGPGPARTSLPNSGAETTCQAPQKPSDT